MKIDRTDKLLTIKLTDNEQIDTVEIKKRSFGENCVQIWIKITEK